MKKKLELTLAKLFDKYLIFNFTLHLLILKFNSENAPILKRFKAL